MHVDTTAAETAAPNETAIKHFVNLLNLPVHELTAIDRAGRVSACLYSDAARLAEQAAYLSDRGQNLYVLFNEFAPNRPVANDWNSVQNPTYRRIQDADVSRLRGLFVDLDPVRPSGTNSTDAEHRAAIAKAREIAGYLTALGFPAPLIFSSGNGAGLLYRVDLPPEYKTLVEAFLAKLVQFDSPSVKVDQSVWNPARLMRCLGTVNRKAAHTDERPQRLAEIIECPDSLVAVPRELIEAFAGPVAAAPEPEPEAFDDQVFAAAIEETSKRLNDAGADHTIDRRPNKAYLKLARCPFKSKDHPNGGATIIIRPSGRLGFACKHSKCNGADGKRKTIRSVEYKLGVSLRVEKAALSRVITGGNRSYDDPEYLADVFVSATAHNGKPTIAVIDDAIFEWTERDAWVERSLAYLQSIIRPHVQAVFDRAARRLPEHVTTRVLANTAQAVRSRTLCRTSRNTRVPFWLRPHEWNADDLLIVANGVLNVRKLAANESEHFIPVTPELFYLSQSRCPYLQDAPAAATFLRFLDSLEWSADQVALLQEWFGYCLLPSLDLQRFMIFYRASRGGKGTLADVLSDTLGRHLVTSPSIGDFGSDFGLENLPDSRLVRMGEMRTPSPDESRRFIQKLNELTGGDEIQINRKYRSFWRGVPRAKILMLTNEVLSLSDNSGRLAARTLLLPFTVSFAGREDQRLRDKLAPELPGILLWAIDGLRRLLNRLAFTMPDESAAEIAELYGSTSPVRTFAEMVCEVDQSLGVQTAALYSIYERWSRQHGYSPISARVFPSELKSVLLRVSRTRLEGASSARGCKIISTDFDHKAKRPEVWLGVVPKSEYRGI
jgi:putative DNA primase/helicase